MTRLKRFLFCSIALASGILSVSLAHAGDARTADDEAIQVWVGTYEDYQEEGIAYGCGAFLLPVDTGIPRSGDAAEDLRLALEALFAPELEHPEAETETGLKDMRLSVEEIAIVEGEAAVKLGGRLLGPGHCGDAIIEGQILHTIFQFKAIERAIVTDGEINLWEMIDLTGWHSEAYRDNYAYERPDAEPETIQFWVGTFEDHEADGIPYGCDSYLLPVDTKIARSGSPYIDLRVALEALFDPELDHPSAETEGWLKGLGLTVQEISLVEGAADIRLGGELAGIGSCGDAIMEGQLLQTVFQFDFIERVKISDGVSNLWQIVDQSDRLSEQELKSYIYERENLDWLRN